MPAANTGKGRLTVTPAEAAQHLGVTEKALGGWRSRGCGPKYVKLGPGGRTSRVRYRLADLEHYLAECERRSTSEAGAAVSA